MRDGGAIPACMAGVYCSTRKRAAPARAEARKAGSETRPQGRKCEERRASVDTGPEARFAIDSRQQACTRRLRTAGIENLVVYHRKKGDES